MYHFIGIKGSGMSALAVIMKQLGYEVEGSDYENHFFTEDALVKNGISIFPFDKENIRDNMIIVQGNMFGDDNVEVCESKKKNLKIYSYQEMVSLITDGFDLIAVSGCHGKTTTSSMLAHVLESSYLIGDGSGKISKGNYFVLEACEYKRHFLEYNPNYVIVTNIDLDHIDYYNDIDDVVDAYNSFIKDADIIIACGDSCYTHRLNRDNIYYYGVGEKNQFKALNIEYYENGISFDFFDMDKYIYHFDLPFYGRHMVMNSLAVISLCYIEGMDLSIVSERLLSFLGAKRRFCERMVCDNVIIDDYAHHPSEVGAVIDAVRQKYPHKDLVAIFEPHTFSRTKEFFSQISDELNKCDYAYVMDIYKSRERQEDYPDVTSDLIIKRLKNGEFFDKNSIDILLRHHDSVLLFMSPNDLRNLEDKYIEQYILRNNLK